MPWTVYSADIYNSAFSVLVGLHVHGGVLTYQRFGQSLPRVMTKRKERIRRSIHIPPRHVKSALAPIHWACDLAGVPPLSALVVNASSLQPGRGCDGTVGDVRNYKYNYSLIKANLDKITGNAEVIRTMFRHEDGDRTARRVRLEGLLCQK
jgi:hypothetical protein